MEKLTAKASERWKEEVRKYLKDTILKAKGRVL